MRAEPVRVGVLDVGAGPKDIRQLAVAAELCTRGQRGVGARAEPVRVVDVGARLPALGQLAVAAELRARGQHGVATWGGVAWQRTIAAELRTRGQRGVGARAEPV